MHLIVKKAQKQYWEKEGSNEWSQKSPRIGTEIDNHGLYRKKSQYNKRGE